MADLAWTKKLKTPEEKKQYLESLQRVKWVLEDLKGLVESNQASREAAEISPAAYDNANWPYRQAHNNGYKQALRDFLALITI